MSSSDTFLIFEPLFLLLVPMCLGFAIAHILDNIRGESMD